MGYKKSDVQTHRIGYGRESYPSVCVKCYKFPASSEIQDRFKCSEKTAERAAMFAWESSVESFWEWVDGFAKEHFAGRRVSISSEGRSGGWLIVGGLPDIKTWSIQLLSIWRSFESSCIREIKHLSSFDVIMENIEANRWAEDNSEHYNFIDIDGTTVCLSDVKRCLRCQ